MRPCILEELDHPHSFSVSLRHPYVSGILPTNVPMQEITVGHRYCEIEIEYKDTKEKRGRSGGQRLGWFVEGAPKRKCSAGTCPASLVPHIVKRLGLVPKLQGV